MIKKEVRKFPEPLLNICIILELENSSLLQKHDLFPDYRFIGFLN